MWAYITPGCCDEWAAGVHSPWVLSEILSKHALELFYQAQGSMPQKIDKDNQETDAGSHRQLFLEGTTHVNSGHSRWAEGSGWAIPRAEQQPHCPVTITFQFCVSHVSLGYQSNEAWSLCPRGPQVKTRPSLLRIQRGVPWTRHRDWYHVFYPIMVWLFSHPTNDKTKYFSVNK